MTFNILFRHILNSLPHFYPYNNTYSMLHLLGICFKYTILIFHMLVHVDIHLTSTILFFFSLPASGVLPSGKVMHLQPVGLLSQYLPKLSAFTKGREKQITVRLKKKKIKHIQYSIPGHTPQNTS